MKGFFKNRAASDRAASDKAGASKSATAKTVSDKAATAKTSTDKAASAKTATTRANPFKIKPCSVKPYIEAIRNGLIVIIPVLLVGSVFLMLSTLPIEAYQRFIGSFCGGVLADFFLFMHSSTLGLISFHATLSIGMAYLKVSYDKKGFYFGGLLSILTSYIITIGFFNKGFDLSCFGGRGMVASIVCSIVAGGLHTRIKARVQDRLVIVTEGADAIFDKILLETIPFLCVTSSFVLLTVIMKYAFMQASLLDAFINLMNKLFLETSHDFLNGEFFLLFTTVLWFFGIHGSNVMENTARALFVEIKPLFITNKCFIDVFVLMGGCGTMLTLVLSCILFSRRRSVKRHALLSLTPCLFNISELMMFGLPVVFNRYLLFPFILTPLTTFTTSYLATKWGLVPLAQHFVSWTTPIFISGYVATGSIRGSFLQLFNLLLGIFIYTPWVRLNDRKVLSNHGNTMDSLLDILHRKEISLQDVNLLELSGPEGSLAKTLSNDLKDYLQGPIDMKYQVQKNHQGKIIGAEALLRWNHATYGLIYPPLVIKLANERDFLWDLEKKILTTCASSYASFREAYGDSFKLSVNCTVESFYKEDFMSFLRDLKATYGLRPGNLCIEITEESELKADLDTSRIFSEVQKEGYLLALDDFSMGHTSLSYLLKNHFNFVKLDGSIVREIETNPRSLDIIGSIVELSKNLDFKVIAEFVETQNQASILQGAGCLLYQGYLFGKAIDQASFLETYKE